MKLSIGKIPILPVILFLLIGGSSLFFFQKVRYGIIKFALLAGFQLDYLRLNELLFALAFTIFSGFIIFCFILFFIEKGTLNLILSGGIKNISHKYSKTDFFLFGVSSLLIGYILYEYFVLPTIIDFEFVSDRMYLYYVLNSNNIFRELFEKITKLTLYETNGYRPRLLSYVFTILDTNLLLALGKYVGGAANFPLILVAVILLVCVIYALVRLLFPNIPKSICLLCSTFTLTFCNLQSCIGYMIRSGKVFNPVFCLLLFYMFIHELKKPADPGNIQKQVLAIKNAAMIFIIFLSLLVDEQIVFTLFFMTFLSFIIRFLFKKRIGRILIIFSVCCCLYILFYLVIGKLIFYGTLNNPQNYHNEQFFKKFMSPITIIKTIYWAYDVWSAALSYLFVSFNAIAMFFILMQFSLIKKRKYVESFICISGFLFSYFIVFLIVAAHDAIYQNSEHSNSSFYLLPSAYLSFGIVLYGLSALNLSFKTISRVLSFVCISIILYNAPKMGDYYHAMILSGGIKIVQDDYTQDEKEFIKLLKDHGVNKYFLTRTDPQQLSALADEKMKKAIIK